MKLPDPAGTEPGPTKASAYAIIRFLNGRAGLCAGQFEALERFTPSAFRSPQATDYCGQWNES